MWANQKLRGFTIVELLIVIVVIGVLAAISIVAYTGIQNRAHDSAVQSDLAAAAKALELYKTDKGTYPDSETKLDEMSSIAPLKASKQAYVTGILYNYTYCWTSSNSSYGLAAQSKSGTAYYVTNSSGSVKVFSSWGTSVTTICPALGQAGGVWGYRGNTQNWASWVSG